MANLSSAFLVLSLFYVIQEAMGVRGNATFREAAGSDFALVFQVSEPVNPCMKNKPNLYYSLLTIITLV